MKNRCSWCLSDPLYIDYHDKEWGVPLYDDQKLFEFLVLEGAQAGLSWFTVLKKREQYRKLFHDFDPKKVARFDKRKVESLLKNPGIIRNRLKVESAIKNAKAFLKIQDEFGSFSNYSWKFVNYKPIQSQLKSLKNIKAVSEESLALSKDLKKRGFTFVGPTIIYAHMQACGMVNDHVEDCFRHKPVAKMGKAKV